MRFVNRVDAGRHLARQLKRLRGEDVVVLGLPRGGVPVAFEVARILHAPLDLIMVRKIGVPFQPELAMGAVGEDGVVIRESSVLRHTGISEAEFTAIQHREQGELERRAELFRKDRPRLPLTGQIAVVVDDGMATGSTARAACRVAREQGAARVVLGVPVASREAVELLRGEADEVVCLETPRTLFAVGQWYEDFAPTTDDDVIALLALAAEPEASADPPPEVEFAVDGVTLAGRLTVPEGANGLILFAHGSGSSRHSPRNRFVAEVLNQAGLGTLLFDLLTPGEEHDRARVFDIGMLGHRLAEVTRQVRGDHAWIGYFGASTGAAAALWAAAEPDLDIASIVSRGGRPDLAESKLGQVRAPTLLIVGGLDEVVLDLNRHARKRLRCTCALTIVPGATHLFEEPGALRTVADLARDWFTSHVPADTRR